MDPRDFEAFSQLLKDCEPYADARAVVDSLGIESMKCFALVDEYDYVNIGGIKIVHARKLALKLKSLRENISSEANRESLCEDACANRPVLHEHTLGKYTLQNPSASIEKNEGNSLSKGDEDFDIEAAVEEERRFSSGCAADTSDCLPQKSSSGLKRKRNSKRYGKKRSGQALLVEMNGEKRIRLNERAARVEPGENGGRPGVSVRTIVGNTWHCSEKLDAVIPQLLGAVRTRSERQTRAKEAKNHVDKVGKYNLSRLATLVTPLLFGPLGNFLFHGVCIRKKLGLGSDWLSSAHRRAISLSQVSVVKVKKESLPKVNDLLLGKVIVPEGVVLSAKEYLKPIQPTQTVTLVRDRSNFHGLSGALSNRTKREARKFIAAFTRQNSSPNGRTRDAHGRFHGAPNYLDAKFLLYIQERPDEDRLAFLIWPLPVMSICAVWLL